MRRVTALLSAAAVVVWMTAAFAQTPNFAGTWTRDAGAAPAGGGGGGAAGGGGGGGQRGGGGGGGLFACGMECTIVQDAKTITIKRAAGQGGQAPADVVINLTGDTKMTQPAGRNGGTATEYTVTAKADGGKWVLTSTRDMGGTSVTQTSTLSVAGNKLTVVNSSNREGATPQTQTYTKK